MPPGHSSVPSSPEPGPPRWGPGSQAIIGVILVFLLYLEAEHLGVHQEEGVVDGQEAADAQDELAWG